MESRIACCDHHSTAGNACQYRTLTYRGLTLASLASSFCLTSSLCLSAASCTARRFSSAKAAWCARRAASCRGQRTTQHNACQAVCQTMAEVLLRMAGCQGFVEPASRWTRFPDSRHYNQVLTAVVACCGNEAVVRQLCSSDAPRRALPASWPCDQPQPAPWPQWLPAGQLSAQLASSAAGHRTRRTPQPASMAPSSLKAVFVATPRLHQSLVGSCAMQLACCAK